MPLDAIVVLGCRVGARGELLGAARRRVARAFSAYRERGEPMLILSGGKRWHGQSEADAFAAELERLGVSSERLLRERASHSTRENARYTCELAREHGFRQLAIVTCEWHLARAAADFRSYGFEVECIGAPAPVHVGRARRFTERGQAIWDQALIRLERIGLLVLCLAATLFAACQRQSPPGAGGKTTASASVRVANDATPDRVAALLRAELARRADQVPSDALAARDSHVRAAATRALSRSADASSVDKLLPGLADDSPRVLTFAAWGLGRIGTARAGAVTSACALRAASLLTATPAPRDIDAMMSALAEAIGRIGSEEGERTLRSWLSLEPGIAESAALALGELGARRARLEDETFVQLLDAAEHGNQAALYAFSRVLPPAGAIQQRLRDIASRTLNAGHSESRAYALRTLDRLAAVEPLANALADASLEPGLRAEVTRALSHLGDSGVLALGRHLGTLPTDASARAALLESPEFPAWLGLLEVLQTAPASARDALTSLAALELPDVAWKARRGVLLRCAAARLLAGNTFDAPELTRCDPNPDGRSGQLAMLAVLDRGKLAGARATRFAKLAESSDAVVRQAALRVLAKHIDIQQSAKFLVRGLADAAPGCVAAAAEVLAQRPELAAPPDAKRQGASQGSADEAVSQALVRAYRQHANGENPAVLSALIDAAASLQLLALMNDLERTCELPSQTLREHVERAFTAFGRLGKRCGQTKGAAKLPAELDHLVARPIQIVFETELGELSLSLDPSDAPVAVTRIADLVKAGFYDGVDVHRFIAGFVLQFGDRGGDGYGGAGRPLLRSEISPRRLGLRSVGLAESGPDTGSGQLFITLGRFPHLDGSATYLGEASPGWERLVAGDRILKARLRN
ncbi:MAG: ElyC/SanA/YdcF family protein [Myxococcota bacterium]